MTREELRDIILTPQALIPVGVAVTMVVLAISLAYKFGGSESSAMARIAKIEADVADLRGKYARIAEEGVLPAAVERRLSHMEDKLSDIQRDLRNLIALQSNRSGPTSSTAAYRLSIPSPSIRQE